MSQKITFDAATINTGAAMLADGRTETAWSFYELAAAAVPATLEGKALTGVLDTLRDKLIAKRFGKVDLTADEARASKVPSVGTMRKRLTDVRPAIGADDVDRGVSLEAFGHVYRSPAAGKDLAKANDLIKAFTAENGHAPSVREAREGFGRDAKVKTGAAADGGPATVGEMIEYLIGQPKAVQGYVREFPEVAATLAVMLTTADQQVAA